MGEKMKYDPDIHHRRSIRLRGYDYAAGGVYFVTICVQGRECLFGKILNDVMVPNAAGVMVMAVWNELAAHYPGVAVDASVTMPNHFHGIIMLNVGAAPRGRPGFTGPRACPDFAGPREQGHPRGGAPTLSVEGHPQDGAPTLSLFDVVHRFKSLTTARYRHGVLNDHWPPFAGRLWQRNYYERIIRDEIELSAVREYIQFNPTNWAEDEDHP